MSNLLLPLLGLVVLAAALAIIYRTFAGGRGGEARDDYRHALELWIEGDREAAAQLLRQVVQADPQGVEPFLYLGVLLRLQGDAAKAAVLHRGLTVRQDLSLDQKVSVGLELAEDLIDLERWAEAGQVLDGIQRPAMSRKRYWLARFAQHVGGGDLPEAARTLKQAPRHCPAKDQAELSRAYTAFQLDRALLHALAGEEQAARSRVRDVAKMPDASARAALVRGILAAQADDAAGALTEAASNLLDHPEELRLFLPVIQEALLRSGQFARTIPILESACQAEKAPPSLWINLALLYEKLEQRDKALRMLGSKAGQAGFTPDAAAPYLRLLTRDAPDTDFARVWDMLSMPTGPETWTCCDCGREEVHIRWYCPACGGFDSYRLGCKQREAT